MGENFGGMGQSRTEPDPYFSHRADFLARARRDQGAKVRFIYSWDDFDVSRKGARAGFLTTDNPDYVEYAADLKRTARVSPHWVTGLPAAAVRMGGHVLEAEILYSALVRRGILRPAPARKPAAD